MRGIISAKPLDVNNNSKLHVLNSGGGKQGTTLHTQQLMPKVVALYFIHLPDSFSSNIAQIVTLGIISFESIAFNKPLHHSGSILSGKASQI